MAEYLPPPGPEHVRVRDYGCTRCQRYHREGDALYAEHLIWQSKHGIREYNEHVETALRVALGGASEGGHAAI